MKKLLVLGAIASVVAFSSVASANSGTINFTGTITSATCTISPVVNGGVSSSINLGNLDTSLTGAKAVPFSLAPAGTSASDCLAKTAADISWSSPVMDPAGLANNGGSATGVSLELKAINATKANDLVTDSNRVIAYSVTAPTKLAKFDYEAKLVKTVTSGAISAGNFTTSASYTVAYK